MRGRSMAGAVALLVLAAVPLSAQRGSRAPMRGPAMERGVPGAALDRQVEAALERREALGLDEAQVAELQRLRADLEGAMGPIRSELDQLRSETRDRSGDREEVRARMEAIRDRHRALRARMDTVRAPLQARFEQAVPPLQRRDLRVAQRQDRREGVRDRRIALAEGARGTPGRGLNRPGLRGDRGRMPAAAFRGDRRGGGGPGMVPPRRPLRRPGGGFGSPGR